MKKEYKSPEIEFIAFSLTKDILEDPSLEEGWGDGFTEDIIAKNPMPINSSGFGW